MEILAPAGNMQALIAAVRCGANAVYLGTGELNARRNAGNFDCEELNHAVQYCHSHGVKVYLTLNTLVSDREIRIAYNTVDKAMAAGIDAFIVQDMGVARMIGQSFPDARLHASTQCSATTPDGFRALEEMGYSRAVLPREMSADEINEIRKSCGMELESFVHGALCMCVSGQCYLSAILGDRSGNRGLCAQPCRMQFSADGNGGCDLSLKDLSLIRHIDRLKSLGVYSLKIEGRMKRPEYVAAAVTACRNALQNTYTDKQEDVLKSVFSRSGFTDGYFTGKRQNMFGTRRREDVIAASNVLKELSHLYDKENPLLPITLSFTCKKDRPCTLTAESIGKSVTVTSEIPQTAVNKPMTSDIVSSRLSKLGGTQYYAKEIKIDLDPGLIMSAGVINGMRRDAVSRLDEPIYTKYERRELENVPKVRHGKKYMTARFLHPDRIPENHPFKRVFIPIWSNDKYFASDNVGVEIPRGLFGSENQLKKRLTYLKSIGVTMALCPDIGAYKTASDIGFNTYGDFGMNVFNSFSAGQISSPLLSFELTLEQSGAVHAPDTGIVAYGKLPLMLTRNCPVKNRIGCEKCKKNGKLTDRKGFEFPVKCSPYPCVEILNPIPLYIGDRMNEVGTDFVHLYFTDEDSAEVKRVIDLFRKHAPYGSKYTRGLYYRGVK